MKMITLTLAALAAGACGGSRSGLIASPTTTAPPVVAAASKAPRPIPAWVDPVLIDTLLTTRRFSGPFHVCLGPDVDVAGVEQALGEVLALTGVRRTGDGPCSVTINRAPGRDHSNTSIGGTDTATSDVVTLYDDSPATIRHELGHVLGFGHSPRRQDLMNATMYTNDFSPDEQAILAWMYS